MQQSDWMTAMSYHSYLSRKSILNVSFITECLSIMQYLKPMNLDLQKSWNLTGRCQGWACLGIPDQKQAKEINIFVASADV